MDPLSDMLTRIRNAYAAGNTETRVPFSRLKQAVAEVLAREQFIESVESKGRMPQRELRIILRYVDGKPAIEGVRRISRPGQRQYTNVRTLRPTHYGFGLTILSTSSGVMSDKDAKKQKSGGEILCEVW